MRNILGERVLGLPKDPDSSRELPVERGAALRADGGARIGVVNPELERFLLDRGATAEEVRRAESEGWLTLLAIDRSLSGQAAVYSRAEVAAAFRGRSRGVA